MNHRSLHISTIALISVLSTACQSLDQSHLRELPKNGAQISEHTRLIVRGELEKLDTGAGEPTSHERYTKQAPQHFNYQLDTE